MKQSKAVMILNLSISAALLLAQGTEAHAPTFPLLLVHRTPRLTTPAFSAIPSHGWLLRSVVVPSSAHNLTALAVTSHVLTAHNLTALAVTPHGLTARALTMQIVHPTKPIPEELFTPRSKSFDDNFELHELITRVQGRAATALLSALNRYHAGARALDAFDAHRGLHLRDDELIAFIAKRNQLLAAHEFNTRALEGVLAEVNQSLQHHEISLPLFP